MSTALDICRNNAALAAAARARLPIADPRPDFRNLDVERKRAAMIFIDCKPHAFRSDFREWLTENWHVYIEFERRVDVLYRAGHRHWGARNVWENMRYDSAICELSGEWKLNDHRPPCCARLWMMMHPSCAGFFETRAGQSAVRSE